ncbi:AmmeMemoRadiSam system protein B [Metapseudomonas boanensis]|uniref:MEMO1 family protein J7302_23530 n=1 Tax=Metapseudomonas boanensis TaxID=2822138 RepID=A0ABS5XMZ9_9GAMM|nr:AmmeMemoRadiSam system protein B [Pseudomonas boanensis]MBT8769081.1 AmmeMemoRadiSam system protein B [Pseudomonas boanensis]
MNIVRPAAVAGTFYPADPEQLARDVRQLLSAVAPAPAAPGLKALIVPHAGYIYSGAVAAQAYARLKPLASRIERVVLLGPVHRVPVRGLALPQANAFSTPLGQVQLDAEAMAVLADLPKVVISAEAHALEHSLEVQLPFLQSVLGEFRLVPLAVGSATPAEVAQVLARVWGGDETLIVISSDLSHFLPYTVAQKADSETIREILAERPALNHEQACGATPINGLLAFAARQGLRAELLGQCNSGDTAGDKFRVVGYASVAFYQTSKAVQDADDAGKTLLNVARDAISQHLGGPGRTPPDQRWLHEPGASFVTLTHQGRLRGCIGTIEAHRRLIEDVQENAIAAATRDPRFDALTRDELARTRIEVSLLSATEVLAFTSERQALEQLRPGVDGIILEYGRARGTFLPQVWDSLPQPNEFLAMLKRKAGLPADFWHTDIRLARYTVNKWQEVGDE